MLLSPIKNIPKDWKIVELQNAGEVIYGIQASVANNIEPIGTKILTNKNITLDGGFDLEKINYFELKTKRHKETILKQGDILFNWRSGSKDHVGKTAYFNLDGQYTHSSFILRIRCNTNTIYGKYCYYYLLWLHKSKYFLKLQTYAINAKFNKSAVNLLPIILPPIEEQIKIVNVLSLVQKAISEQEKAIALTTELKKALMQKLFTEGLNNEPQKMTEIGLIPESWEVKELKYFIEIPQYGFTDSASDKGNTKFLRITDITEFGVNWNTVPFCNCPIEKIDQYLLKDNDIVFARIGATTGKSYIIKNPPFSVFASYLIRVRAIKIDPDYLFQFFQTQIYWQQINARKDDSLKKGVNGSVLKNILIPIPLEKEQKEIAKIFQTFEQETNLLMIKKSQLQELFKTLLHQLMTAQIRVDELDLSVLETQIEEVRN